MAIEMRGRISVAIHIGANSVISEENQFHGEYTEVDLCGR